VPSIPTGGHARLEVIVGSMFSGKSEELIRRAKRAIIARRAVQVFKPSIDDRFGNASVRSHDGYSFVALPVRPSADVSRSVEPETSASTWSSSSIPASSMWSARWFRAGVG
jgi:thymidine kinase